MRPTVSQYAKSLDILSSEATEENVSHIVANFFQFLKRRGDWNKRQAILEYLEKMHREQSGELTVRAIVAHEPDAETKEEITLQAKRLFPEKKILLSYEVEKNMIGGVMLRTDEVMYDATLKTQVHNLNKSLLKV